LPPRIRVHDRRLHPAGDRPVERDQLPPGGAAEERRPARQSRRRTPDPAADARTGDRRPCRPRQPLRPAPLARSVLGRRAPGPPPPDSARMPAVTRCDVKAYVGGTVQRHISIDPSVACSSGCAHTLTGLTRGTRYVLVLRAVNTVGAGPGAKVGVTA